MTNLRHDYPELQPRRPSLREQMNSPAAWQTRVLAWAALFVALLVVALLLPGDPATDCAVVDEAAARVSAYGARQ